MLFLFALKMFWDDSREKKYQKIELFPELKLSCPYSVQYDFVFGVIKNNSEQFKFVCNSMGYVTNYKSCHVICIY